MVLSMHREQLQSLIGSGRLNKLFVCPGVIFGWTGCGLLTAAAGQAACGLFHPPFHEHTD